MHQYTCTIFIHTYVYHTYVYTGFSTEACVLSLITVASYSRQVLSQAPGLPASLQLELNCQVDFAHSKPTARACTACPNTGEAILKSDT